MNADEKICPRCAETIKDAAVVCRFCGHEFGGTPDAMRADETPNEPSRKNRWIIVAAAVGLLLLIGGLAAISFGGRSGLSTNAAQTTANFAVIDANGTDDGQANASTNVDADTVDMNAIGSPETLQSTAWDYFDTFDQVRGQTVYHASMESENAADFDFPYQGGSKLTMTVRWHPKLGQDLIFKISKGQFVCGVEDCSGTINLGSGAQTISLSQPTDNSSDTLFVTDSGTIVDQLKKAKRVIVELPFYQEGNRQFTFEMTSPLNWPPKGAEANSLATENDNIEE